MTEVCCVLAALALLMMVALPALGMSKGRSQRIVCVNNLSRIGQATTMWANEHDGRRPLMTPYWQGGVQSSGNVGSPPSGTPAWQWGALNNQAWFHYFWLSNELVTPKVLLCPSETNPGRRPAGDWSASSATGLLHPNFRGNAVSYVVAHSTSDNERGLVSADRNLPVTGNSASCSYGYFGIVVIAPTFLPLSWAGTLPLHYQEGNLLYNDGSVETADDVRLRAIFDAVSPSCSGTHFIAP